MGDWEFNRKFNYITNLTINFNHVKLDVAICKWDNYWSLIVLKFTSIDGIRKKLNPIVDLSWFAFNIKILNIYLFKVTKMTSFPYAWLA